MARSTTQMQREVFIVRERTTKRNPVKLLLWRTYTGAARQKSIISHFHLITRQQIAPTVRAGLGIKAGQCASQTNSTYVPRGHNALIPSCDSRTMRVITCLPQNIHKQCGRYLRPGWRRRLCRKKRARETSENRRGMSRTQWGRPGRWRFNLDPTDRCAPNKLRDRRENL